MPRAAAGEGSSQQIKSTHNLHGGKGGEINATMGETRVLSLTCPMEEEWRLYDGMHAPMSRISQVVGQFALQVQATKRGATWDEFGVPGV